MKDIKVQYYAVLREQRGVNAETVQTDSNTVEELYSELKERFGFNLDIAVVKAAVNNDFVDWKTVLNEGDQVVFIPPVAGG